MASHHHSDDDVTEASIYDLDHAPPPPLSRPGGESPRPKPAMRPSLSRRSLSLSLDGILSHGSKHEHGSKQETSSFSSLWLSKDPQSHDRNGPPVSPRQRAQSQSSLFPWTAHADDAPNNPPLSPTRSFPPLHMDDRKVVAFSSTTRPLEMTEPLDDVDEDPHEQDISNDNLDIEDSSRSPNHPQSTSSGHFSGCGDEWDNDGADSESVATSSRDPVVVLGVKLPVWCSKRRISWNRVATFVVEKAPCFLCMRMKQGTYRSVLVRLNILCACCAAVQLAMSLWFYIIMQNSSIVDRNLLTETQSELDRQSNFEVVTNVWNLNGPVWCLGACAAVVLVAIGLTVRVVQTVNLVGAVRFLWVILWVIPLQVFWTIGLFDYFQVTPVWIKFWWRDRTMTWFRNRFCHPDTANSLCAVPVFDSTEDSTSWCLINYGAENCTDIRDEAQEQMERFVYKFYYAYAAWTIAFLLLLFLVVKTLESIVSQPLVQKSRESNVPVWLLLPIIGCTVSGTLYSFSTTSVLSTRVDARSQTSWIGPLFILAGGMFLLAALLALLLGSFKILNTRDKRRKSIAIVGFIVLSISLVLVLTTVFSACIAFSLSYEELPISEQIRGDIACFIDQSGSCSDCNNTEGPRCSEWSNDDVTRIIQSQAKAGASLAGIFLMYAFGALRYGLALRNHMSNYMIDYI